LSIVYCGIRISSQVDNVDGEPKEGAEGKAIMCIEGVPQDLMKS
jgi:hypothetical protein